MRLLTSRYKDGRYDSKLTGQQEIPNQSHLHLRMTFKIVGERKLYEWERVSLQTVIQGYYPNSGQLLS